MEEYLTPDEAATYIKVKPSTILEWCEQKRFTAFRLPSPLEAEWRIARESFQSFVDDLTVASITPNPQAPVLLLAEHTLRNLAPGATVTSREDTCTVFINRPTIQRIALGCWKEGDDWLMQFRTWPGDTAAQSRLLYDKLDIPACLALRQDTSNGWDGWGILPNPHISHVQSHLVYRENFAIPQEEKNSQVELDAFLDDYLAYWQKHKEAIGQYSRGDGGGNFAGLLAAIKEIHPLSPEGEENFNTAFIKTQRQTATFTPGLYLGFTISYRQALVLSAKGELIDKVRARINQALGTWQECLP